MSFEINPVLAGKFDTPDYAAVNNIASTAGTDDVSGPDPRRYTQFDRTVTNAGSTTDFSFGDLVDMLNPLEHIPIVSSVYRAIVGETINPVSRVTGDILYGGALGVASAVIGGAGAVADTELVADTGKDSGGLVLAALFGPDKTENPVQLADAGTAPPAAAANLPPGSKNIMLTQAATATPSLAAAQIPDNVPVTNAALPDAPALNTHMADVPAPQPAPAAQVAAAASTATGSISAAASPQAGAASTPTAPSGTIPLLASTNSTAGAKQAFGGVMAPNQPNLQAQDMAIALAQGAPSMRLGHTIYTNKLMNGPHPLPPMLSSGGAAPAASGNATTPGPVYAPPPVVPASFTSSSAASPPSLTNPANTAVFASGGMSPVPPNQVPPELMQDMMLKALSQYRSIAAGPSGAGGTVNLTN